MSNLKTDCDQCTAEFDPKKNLASKRAITLAGASAGAVGGAKVGLALGPYGAISGTVPGAVAGVTAGHLIDRSWVTCPNCGTTKTV